MVKMVNTQISVYGPYLHISKVVINGTSNLFDFFYQLVTSIGLY